MMGGRVGTVGEPAGDVGGGDGGESGPGGGAEGVIGAGVRASEELFDRGEGVLDRIEVRGVGGQGQEASAACLDGRAEGRVVMGGEVVGDDDLAWSEGGARRWRTYPTKRSAVMAPSNRRSGPTPARVSAATTVLFSPRLAGAVA
jgi:hypothetical protein